MVRASNPKLMVRVLDAVANLSDSRGSSAREVLSFIRMSNVSSKNLTLQVHRALKNAVNAGLLRHRSGRYKVLATLSPASDLPVPPVGVEPTGGGEKTDNKRTPKSDAPFPVAPIGGTETPRRKQERKKKTTSQRQSSKRRSSGTRRRTRRSPHKRTNTTGQSRKRRQRKRSYEDEDQSSGRYVSYNRDAESPSFKRRTKRPRLFRRESDFSDDESDRESYVSRKRVSRANKSSRRDKPSEATRVKSRDRSASRARSPQRNVQARQYSLEIAGNDDGRQYDEDRRSAEHDAARQEAREDVEGCAREPNDSNSGSTLENS